MTTVPRGPQSPRGNQLTRSQRCASRRAMPLKAGDSITIVRSGCDNMRRPGDRNGLHRSLAASQRMNRKRAFAQVRVVNILWSGAGRTADLPLFRIKDHRVRPARVVCLPAQRAAVDADGPRCTWMYETTSSMTVTLTIMKRASAQVRGVVRGGVEPPTFRFSGLRITVYDRPGWSVCLLSEPR